MDELPLQLPSAVDRVLSEEAELVACGHYHTFSGRQSCIYMIHIRTSIIHGLAIYGIVRAVYNHGLYDL